MLPIPTTDELLANARLRLRQEKLVDILRRRKPERFYLPIWEGGPSAAQLNLGFFPEWAGRIEALIEELEG